VNGKYIILNLYIMFLFLFKGVMNWVLNFFILLSEVNLRLSLGFYIKKHQNE